jgi:hypothetical protein
MEGINCKMKYKKPWVHYLFAQDLSTYPLQLNLFNFFKKGLNYKVVRIKATVLRFLSEYFAPQGVFASTCIITSSLKFNAS